MESIANIAVVSCGLKIHLQILVIGYVRYRCWVLIYLTIAPYNGVTFRSSCESGSRRSSSGSQVLGRVNKRLFLRLVYYSKNWITSM